MGAYFFIDFLKEIFWSNSEEKKEYIDPWLDSKYLITNYS